MTVRSSGVGDPLGIGDEAGDDVDGAEAEGQEALVRGADRFRVARASHLER